MADSCSDTIDGEILGISEGQKLNATKNEDFDSAGPQEKEISQKEGVTDVVGSTEQSSVGSIPHVMKDNTTPRKDPPTTTSSLEDDGKTAQSLSVTSRSQDKTDDSEIINSQSYTPSQTPTFSMASVEFSEESNVIPPDGHLISTKSSQDGDNQLSPDQVPSQEGNDAGACAGGAARVMASEPSMPAYYFVKWITWKEKKTAIITQSENGPCPLIAIMNILLLRWKVKLPAQSEVVTTEELMAHLGECVLSIKPREKAEGMELNFQQNMSDAMAVLPKLSTGLDVNVRFTGVSDFEYTPECIVFDLIDIPLYHGWLVDPQSPEMVSAVGKLSYNQLVEKIIDFKHSTDSSQVSE
ncbi:ubiquitin carboxyl-terminal hydrolase MINDY-1-like, partial [Xyrauchen texanus]|uniref:ubiquitin carboxyl-terminal hydrolase MINDY-1-like n=1 Tax=Xyrauchen texanus TaxID=154827 RepID=UPI002241C5EF